MKRLLSDIFKIRSILYILIGYVLPVGYTLSLLIFNYQNNLALKDASIKRFKLDIEKHATTVGYFFLERRFDIGALADSTEITTYFTNLSLGMSPQYGLKVSLFSIHQLMENTRKEKILKGSPIFSRLVFMDKNETLLADTRLGAGIDKTVEWVKALPDTQKVPELIITQTAHGYDILVATPCFFRKEITGWIIAWIDMKTLYENFVPSSMELSSRKLSLILEDGRQIMPENMPVQNFWEIPNETLSGIKDLDMVLFKNSKTGSQTLLMTRVQIQECPLSLAAYIEESEIAGQMDGWHLLVGAGALVLLILLGMMFFIRSKTKHLILEARFDESAKKNKALEQAELILKESEERYRKLFESSSDAILIIMGSRIVNCNPKAIELLCLDFESILNRHFHIFSPETQPGGHLSEKTLQEKIDGAETAPQSFEWLLKGPNNELIQTEINMTALSLDSGTYIQAIIRDIRDRKRTQELMVQTEKMMAVGGLAAGMAHEINNPLGIILQANQNISRRLGTALKKNQDTALAIGLDFDKLQLYLTEKKIYDYLTAIQSAGDRAAKIVRSMLDFGRAGNIGKKTLCHVNEIMDNVIEMASNDYDLKKKYDFKAIEIVRQYSNLKGILCDPTEIGQVFLNIIKNAAQAMTKNAAQRPPRILIRTLGVNDRIRIEIEDNGPGIKKENRKTVFEPFYTTKPVGEGTGLGLSVSYFIISTHHNGTLRVESEPGMGTKFIIELPMASFNKEKDVPC